ncbi:hypothetical protein GCM10007919_48420 [Rhizobium indigoferae]|nr:hypothetical protein GCM10007919_48420 [Rhizobium indigoferae]
MGAQGSLRTDDKDGRGLHIERSQIALVRVLREKTKTRTGVYDLLHDIRLLKVYRLQKHHIHITGVAIFAFGSACNQSRHNWQ